MQCRGVPCPPDLSLILLRLEGVATRCIATLIPIDHHPTAIMAAIVSSSLAVRPAAQTLTVRRPAAARAAPKAVRCQAEKEQRQQVLHQLLASCIEEALSTNIRL